MIIISTAKMGYGTLQAKYAPLSQLPQIEKIYVLRKSSGPDVDKVEYILLPRICSFWLFNIFITPFLLCFYTHKVKADLILAYHLVPHAFFAYVASLITKKPYIFGQTGSECQKLANIPGLCLVIKKVMSRAAFINVPGEQSKDFWEEKLNKRGNINLLHSTIDVEKLKPEFSATSLDFLYIGRLDRLKQVDKVINGIKFLMDKYPNVKLGIVGTGPHEHTLKNLVKELNLNDSVIFYGFQKDVRKFYMISRIFIMTSKMEGLPVALMEAMSCEKLVITTGVGNIPTILMNKKTGILLTSDKQEEINITMEDAYVNYDQYEECRKNGRKIIIEKYSYMSANDKWNNILNSIK